MVRKRAFTAQIIINHVQARDDEKIDNVEQALDRAVDNGVKNLIIQPTHLMHGAEYDELTEAVEKYQDKFETVKIAEPLLGEVGSDASAINEDKEAVAKAITAEAVKTAKYDSLDAAAEDGTAFVLWDTEHLIQQRSVIRRCRHRWKNWDTRMYYRNSRRRTGRYIM